MIIGGCPEQQHVLQRRIPAGAFNWDLVGCVLVMRVRKGPVLEHQTWQGVPPGGESAARTGFQGGCWFQDLGVPLPRSAVASISIFMRGSASFASNMVAAGRMSPRNVRRTGQHLGNVEASGRM